MNFGYGMAGCCQLMVNVMSREYCILELRQGGCTGWFFILAVV